VLFGVLEIAGNICHGAPLKKFAPGRRMQSGREVYRRLKTESRKLNRGLERRHVALAGALSRGL
jgi:hypothetical protein